jgi:phage FluMu protein Com
MNKIKCWYCKKEFEYEGEKYRDVTCPHCGVMVSIYNPADNSGENKEGEEMVNYEDEKYQGKFVYMPLMGDTAEFDIVEISEVQGDNPKFNFNEKVPVMANGEQVVDDDGEPVFKQKDLGYHIEAKLRNGKILSVTSMSTFRQVFKKNEIQDGDKVRIFHKDKGEWVVEKI